MPWFRESWGFVSISTLQSYDVYKWFGTLWPENHIRLFAHYTISLSSLCTLSWKHWTYKIIVMYILSSVCLRVSYGMEYAAILARPKGVPYTRVGSISPMQDLTVWPPSCVISKSSRSLAAIFFKRRKHPTLLSSIHLARFDLNKDCCWKNYLQTDSDYFSHSICSVINCISMKITIQLNS